MTLRRMCLIAAPCIVGGVVLLGVCAPDFCAEALARYSPGCAFRRLSGLSCPGCGSTRAVQALLRGEWAEAWRSNVFLWFSFLVAAGVYVGLTRQELRGGGIERPLSRAHVRLLQAYALSIPAWFALRNVLGI